MMTTRHLPLCPIGLVIGLVLWVGTAVAENPHDYTWVRVKWVADGDTIVLRDGRHVRYIGIDAPETAHQQQREEPMAKQARAINQQLVAGWRIRLVFDRERTDRYGRILAYVYRHDGRFVNAELIRRGCAHAFYQWPNTSKAEDLLAAQRDAMQNGLGIWQFIEKKENPHRPYRGNRNTKRFHQYDCPMGRRMAKKNHVWFNNQWAAFWAGYSPARGCIEFP